MSKITNDGLSQSGTG